MKTPIRKWRILVGIVLLLVTGGGIAAPTEDSRYQVLAQDMVIKPDSITSKTGDSLLEFKAIDVGGFRTGRLFVQVIQSDFYKNEGKFTRDSKLRVACFHRTKSGSNLYFEKEIPMTVKTYIGGWVEIPIIGPELRVIVWGDNVPKLEMKGDCTLYLLK